MKIEPSRYEGQIYIERGEIQVTVSERNYPNALQIQFDQSYHVVLRRSKLTKEYILSIIDKKIEPSVPYGTSKSEWEKTLKAVSRNYEVLYEKPTRRKKAVSRKKSVRKAQ